jgi:hypothetical protein
MVRENFNIKFVLRKEKLKWRKEDIRVKKVDKKLYKQIALKESFWNMYKESIILLIVILFLVIFAAVMLLTGNWLILLLTPFVLLGLLICYIAIDTLVDKIKISIRQAKLPLSLKELKMFDIETPSDYSKFICNYLDGHTPYQRVKIIFSAYLYLYKEDPKVKLIVLNRYFVVNEQASFTLKDCDKIFEKGSTLRYKDEITKNEIKDLVKQIFKDTWLENKLYY